jgi:hypothetical protein
MAESSKSGRSMVSRHVKMHKREGMKQSQAVAAALSEARRSGKKVSPRRRGGSKTGTRKSTPGRKMTRTQAARKGGRARARKRSR